MELQEVKPNDCVMVVGTTGTGKSSTINLYTGCEPPQATSESEDPTQQKIEMVKDLNHPGGPPWIDNPGWSDRGKSDSDIFKNMLRHLQTNKIDNIKAVVWNVNINIKYENMMESQAKFIDQFAGSAIWKNVVIICKGYVKDNDANGAVFAAKNCYKGAQPHCLGYKFVTSEDEERISNTLREVKNDEAKLEVEKAIKKEWHNEHKFTNEEIKSKLEEIMKTLTPVPIKFINKKCLDCGQECDERLMEDACHKEKVRGHKGELKQKFSKLAARASTGGGAIAVAGLATTLIVLSPESLGVLALAPILMAPGGYFYGHRALSKSLKPSPGVESVAGACVPAMEYKCCPGVKTKKEGCIEVCNKCNVEWGEKVSAEKGCIFVKEQEKIKQADKYEVFKKNHTLVDV